MQLQPAAEPGHPPARVVLTNDQAILVCGAGINAGVCWDQSPDGVDTTFFDQMLAAFPRSAA